MTTTTPPDEPTIPAAPVPPTEPSASAPGQKKKRKAGLSTWALVLGIIGIVFAFIPYVSGLGIFLGVVALIFGGIGLLRKGGRTISGTALGAVALILGIIFTNVYSSGASSSPAPATSPSDGAASSAAPVAAASPSEPTEPAAPAKPVTPAAPAAPAGTAGQLQALTAAEGYLADRQGFSQAGLIQQLTSSYGSGFAQADAQWAVDHSGADWNAQAIIAAKGYLSDGQGFSQAGLVQQLSSADGSQFTSAEAENAAANSGADWNAQAVIAAKGYLADGQGFSRDGLIQQLTSSFGSQFSEAQAEYAAAQVGLN